MAVKTPANTNLNFERFLFIILKHNMWYRNTVIISCVIHT